MNYEGQVKMPTILCYLQLSSREGQLWERVPKNFTGIHELSVENEESSNTRLGFKCQNITTIQATRFFEYNKNMQI